MAGSDDTSGASVLRSAPRRGRALLTWILLLGVMVCVCVARLCIGSSAVGLPSFAASEVLWLRADRLIVGAIAGAALATAGVALQALLRNALAEPYILGLSTGAALGLLVHQWVQLRMGWPMGEQHVGAACGALLSMAVVFIAGRRRGGIDPLSLLLVGVVVSTINGALIMTTHHLAGPGGLRDDLARWMMGHLNDNASAATTALLATLTVAGWSLLRFNARAMDIATLSDDEALALGVHPSRLRLIEFWIAGLLSAAAVVLAGPVAFVGLIAPHVGRLLVGSLHAPLLLASLIVGITLVVASDTASALIATLTHNAGNPVGLLPLGVFTATLGGISFLFMLRREA